MYSRSMFWKLFFPIAIVLTLSAVAAALYLPTLIRDNAEQEAVAAGQETAEQFVYLRQYYTESVVSKILAKSQLKVSTDHFNDPNTIPLPATMIHDLSALFSPSGTTVKLYSPYPFPNRKERVLDAFGKDAWKFLEANPGKVYYRTEPLGGRTMVRVAVADRMTAQACVNCHNTLATSPKTDWKLGDLRGVLEIDSSRQLDSGERILFQVLATLLLILVLIAVFLRFAYQHSIARPMHAAVGVAHALAVGNAEKLGAIEAVADGDLDREFSTVPLPEIDPRTIANDEAGALLKSVVSMGATQLTIDLALRKMQAVLRHNRDAETTRDWLKTGENELNALMREEQQLGELAQSILKYLVERIGALSGALYWYEPADQKLHLCATYALAGGSKLGEQIALGEGLLGQAALERRTMHTSGLPVEHLLIASSLGQAAPQHVMSIPLIYANNLIGALEIGSFRQYSDTELEFVERARASIAIGIGVALSRLRTQQLLEQTMQQAEELRVQQEELQQSNEELEERAQLLEHQREVIRAKNLELEARNRQMPDKPE